MRVLLEEARLFARNLAYHRRARLEGSPGAGTGGGGAPDRRAATRAAQLTEKKGRSPVGPRPALNDNASHELQYQVDQQDYHEHC